MKPFAAADIFVALCWPKIFQKIKGRETMANNNEYYDLVITGGRVIDPETGLDAKRNLGIKGDKIAAVTKDVIQSKETIDATGHVVAPGFIDMHHHNAGMPGCYHRAALRVC